MALGTPRFLSTTVDGSLLSAEEKGAAACEGVVSGWSVICDAFGSLAAVELIVTQSSGHSDPALLGLLAPVAFPK